MTVGDHGHHHSGQLWIEQRELEGDHGWVALDHTGVVAIAHDRDELLQLLAAEHGGRGSAGE